MSGRYAVVGNPVAHSLSPLIHGLFAAATAQDIEYTKIECPLDGFEETVARFRAEGGRGLNVTVPFKLQALQMAVYLHGAAADKLVGDGIGPVGLTASEVIVAAREVLRGLGRR